MIPIFLTVPALLTVPCSAQSVQAGKPACNEKARGRLWPEKTSRGAAVPIELCAHKGWRYRWQQLTVDVSQLRVTAASKPITVDIASVTRTAVAGNAEDAKAGNAAIPPE
jgi:hypothetical protein